VNHDRGMTDDTRPATILAIVPERDGDAVVARASELAQASGARLILWDADAGTRLLEDPLPTQWSADGEEEQFGDRLTVSDLEAAGRAPFARRLADVQGRGIDAWAWLPSSQDADDLRSYAARHGVGTVVVADDSDLRDELRSGDLRVESVTGARASR
jgi:hypothetical protein